MTLPQPLSKKITTTTVPSTAIVSLSDQKDYMRVEVTDDDSLITALIESATTLVEKMSDVALRDITSVLTMSRFPTLNEPISLYKPPLQSVTSVTYVDGNEATQTLTGFQVIDGSDLLEGAIAPAAGESWPATDLNTLDAVTITYVSGYSAVADVPENYVQAIKMLTAHWYENRMAVTDLSVNKVPLGVESLLPARIKV